MTPALITGYQLRMDIYLFTPSARISRDSRFKYRAVNRGKLVSVPDYVTFQRGQSHRS